MYANFPLIAYSTDPRVEELVVHRLDEDEILYPPEQNEIEDTVARWEIEELLTEEIETAIQRMLPDPLQQLRRAAVRMHIYEEINPAIVAQFTETFEYLVEEDCSAVMREVYAARARRAA